MNDNISAFRSDDYDEKIMQALPYYDEFYEQVVDLVKILKHNAVKWLDIDCGTGKMGSVAYENVEIESLQILLILKFLFGYCIFTYKMLI